MRPSRAADPYASTEDRRSGSTALRGALRLLNRCLPGERLKTSFYLALISKPRKLLRRAVTTFYRFDHVYDVISEFRDDFEGPFSILEFGTAQGYAFNKILYATRHLGVEDRVVVHGFDSFTGLRGVTDIEDRGFCGNDWIEGSYRASEDVLRRHCEAQGYRNFRLHAGDFADTITESLIDELRRDRPILVWVDCDLYRSSRIVLERLLPALPTGCVIYFDDIDFNYFSRFTGQARLVHEINHGAFGPDVELVPDVELSWDSARVFRFVRFGERAISYTRRDRRTAPVSARPIGDGSPLP